MQWHDTPTGYGVTTRLLHGLLAILVLAMYALALIIDQYAEDDPNRGYVVGLHASTGILTLLTAITLLIWRWYNPKPSLALLPLWQQRFARLTHGLLYLCVIAQPISGIIMTLASGHTLKLYGLPILSSLSKNKSLAGAAAGLHGLLPWLLLLLLSLHIGAALYHYFIMRDNILQRMLGRG